MAIDQSRCIGCHACAMACKIANNMPADVVYNRVITVGSDYIDCASGTYENPSLEYLPMQCQHCEEPACLQVCPTGATQKDPDTGIVTVDEELCIGCESCIKACPYEGVRTLLPSEPTYYLDMEVGEADAPKHAGGTVEKCTFCANLVVPQWLAARLQPAWCCARVVLAGGEIWMTPNPRYPRQSRDASTRF